MRMNLESRQGGECGGLGAAGDQLDQEFGRRGKAEHDHGKENSLPQDDRWHSTPESTERLESFGQARPPQGEDGCLSNRDVVPVEVSQDQREVLLRRAGQEAAEALGEDFRLAVAQARLEPQDQAGRLGSVVAQGLGRGDPDILLRVDERIDEDRQQTVHVDPCQREQRRGAEWCGRVLATAPNRLQLHVARGLQKNIRRAMLELVKGLDDRQLRPAELVGLEWVEEEPIEGGCQCRGELEQTLIAGNRRRGGHDQVRSVVYSGLQLGSEFRRRVTVAQQADRGELVIQRETFGHDSRKLQGFRGSTDWGVSSNGTGNRRKPQERRVPDRAFSIWHGYWQLG